MVESQQFFSFCFVSFTRSTNFDRKSSHHQKQKIKKKKKIIFKILFKKKGEKKIYEIEKKGRRARLRIRAKLAPDLNRLLIKRRMRKKGTSASQSSIRLYNTHTHTHTRIRRITLSGGPTASPHHLLQSCCCCLSFAAVE